MKFFNTTILTGGVCLIAATSLQAMQVRQNFSSGIHSPDANELHVSGTSPNPALEALRLEDGLSIDLDGKLDESIWSLAPAAVSFTQRNPDDGSPATQRTEARIIYTDREIYVGITAFDTSPDSIAATLFRRDGDDYSDWVLVAFDSYNDSRTAFNFAVNPRGVQKDFLVYDDSNEDELWDAVWETETEIHSEGWTAELRIPLSQLRYSGRENVQNWGVNFQRWIARLEEMSFWSPTPQDASGKVSMFGRLIGISDLGKPRRLEITPYVSQNLTREPLQEGNPFYRTNNFVTRIGGDIKYGLTPDLTLTATINPDFGQVEADPATINLSAFQTFFPEQRPFFLEGNEIFNFGGTRTYNTFGNPNTFYSRRIGRTPHGSFSDYNQYRDEPLNGINDNLYVDNPQQTSIYGAAKLSGKTRSGWSIGLLNAVTGVERGQYSFGSADGDLRGNFPVEPATNYFVNRLKKDINGGNSTIGTFISATNRGGIKESYFEDFLHTSAYLGGIDFEHNFADRNYTVSGTLSYSQVNGSSEAITRTQRSSARYYQRVDSEKLSVDTNRTRLDGLAAEFSFQKRGGEHTRFSATYSQVTPGYEVNDLGFENRADYRALAFGSMYQESDPESLRFWEAWSYQIFAWNHDGDITDNHYNIGTYVEFNNLWSFNINVNSSPFVTWNDRLTRGGPVAKRPGFINFNFNINSADTKEFSFNVGNFHRWEFRNSEYDHYYWFGINYRPTSNISFRFSPEIGFEKEIDQYITTVEDEFSTATYGNRYVFADIETVNLWLPVRLNWTFSPDISLQTYVRPYISTGKYLTYKEFSRPRSIEFREYATDVGTVSGDGSGRITIDPDGGGPAGAFSFQRPDFNFRTIQTNAIFRWELRPGSTLFLVWQQQRQRNGGDGSFNFRDDFSGIFDVEPTNIFLAKLTWWIGS